MAHQVIDMKCPGCGAPTSTGETTCKYCHRPVIISTFNSVYSMPLPEVHTEKHFLRILTAWSLIIQLLCAT